MLFRKRHDTNYRDLKEAPVPEGQHLLEVDDLKMYFHTQDGVVKAVNGVSYTLDRGETLGVVGESGSGKSVTSLAIMGLIDMPPGRIEGGDIRYHGESLLKMSDEQMGHIRGNGIAMIFQDPMTSLNPVYTIGRQLGEGLRLEEEGPRALDRAAAYGGHTQPRAARQGLPTRVLGWHAPARHDRHGARLRPRHTHRR